MAFPPGFLEELRARVPLSEVVGRRLRLVRAGREFKAPCPFHNEKTPSFTVNDQKGFFHCFGCGAHGDVIGFVVRHDNLSFLEAVEALAAQAGLPVPQATPEERRKYERRKTLHDVIELAARWFEQQLRTPAGTAALAYLRHRGLDDEAIAGFRLGYAPADGGTLRHHLERQGVAEADLVEVGLLRRPEDGRAPFAFFRHRVMFPVSDRRGRVVAFGARLIEGEGPKYINTSETPLFHKGHLLYGLSRARQAAADGAPVIVVEGYMDVIALARAGFPGAVAPLGTALTETQIETVWKLFPGRERVPVLCFDGDTAGRRAAFRAVERILPLLRPDQSVRIAFLPEGEDPDSLIRGRGPGAMSAVLAQARTLADVVWEMETENRRTDTPEAKAGLRAALLERVARIGEPSVQAYYREEIGRRLAEVFSPPRRGAPGPPRAPGRPGTPGAGGLVPRPPPRPRPAENRWQRVLLAALINHVELLPAYAEPLALVEIADPELDELRRELVEIGHHLEGLDRRSLGDRLLGKGHGALLEGLLSEATYAHARFAAPGAEPEAVCAGLETWLAEIGRLRVREEMREAGQALARDGNERNLARLTQLRAELARHIGEEG
jgi:DNA primase